MKKNVLTLKNLTKKKFGNKILDKFYMNIVSGEIINLIGLDGSGRQEIYAILSGKEKIDEGEIWFDNRLYHQYEELPVEQANGLFFIGNYDLIIPDMTIAENLYIIETNYPAFTVPRGFKCRNNREINDTHTNLTTSIYCSKPSSITSPVESKRTELRALR